MMRTGRVALAVGVAITVLLGATVLAIDDGDAQSATTQRVDNRTRDVLRVVISKDARTLETRTVITCTLDANTQRRCDRMAGLTPRHNERCLQVWGGPERALITVPTTGEHVFVSRANSCEMHRWDELQKLLK